ncbi:MAG: cation transporter [Bacilli bacterium]|nr:cation transporter [Bacilli bacterium]
MNRYKKVKIASILGIVGNIFLFVIKVLVGFISHSQAMIADAFNSGGDILSSFITYVGNKISSKPCDDDHNLGHGKAEYIYSMLISVVMIIASLSIFKESLFSLFNNQKYNFSIWLVIVCLITIIVKLFLYIYTINIAKKENNLLIKANSRDHFSDCIITFFNLVSCLLTLKGIYYFDGIVGILISVWIIISSLKIFKESYDVLMDKSISEETKNKVYEIIKKHKEIKRVNHFNSTPVGYRYQISVTIFVNGAMSTFESHEIADKLEKEINEKIEEIYLAVIHVNPIEVNKHRK